MLRLGAQRDELRIVDDQTGTPTPAALIAEVTLKALQHPGQLSGTWHLTASGHTSWHGFADAIFRQALNLGLLEKMPALVPITSTDYPTPAKRPGYSCLDTTTLQRDFGLSLPDWQAGVKQVLAALKPAPILHHV